jgi:hypothetical protein
MTFDGIVRNGTIMLEEGASLPEGTRVKIVAEPAEEGAKPTLIGLLKYAGAAKDLPEDFAAQHDHYIHGMPKR